MAFNEATRQNFVQGPVITYALGQTGFSRVPKVGFIRRILLLFSGTISITLGGGTAALGAEAPWSILSRLRLVANGNTALFDTTGYGALISQLFSAYGFSGFGGRPRIPENVNVPGPTATVFGAVNYIAAATDATAWRFGLEIPLGLSDDWRSPLGLILAAAPDTELQIEATWGATFYSTTAARTTPITTTGAATATMSATLTPWIEYFTIPQSPADYPDLRRIHTWTEVGPQTIAANGDQDVVIQRGNTVMRIAHIVWTNSAPDATAITQLQLRYNTNEVPYTFSRQLAAYLQRQRYVRYLPDGVYAHDLWHSATPRDAINTLNLNELTSRITTSGATIAGTSDRRTSMPRTLVAPSSKTPM